MPGADLAYPNLPGQPDLYPQDEEAHAELLSWCNSALIAAERHRRDKEEGWEKYQKVYRSYVDRNAAPGWRSAASIPYVFSVIEATTPRMVSQLPKFVCRPVGPEDVIPAKAMEFKLQHAADMSDLHWQLVLAIKSALKFGTGILKSFYKQDIRRAYEQVPMTEQVPVTSSTPQMNPDGTVATDMDGNPMETSSTEMVEQPVLGPDGQPMMRAQPYEYVVYQGPAAEWIDIFDFYVAPEATSIESARYVIQRGWRSKEAVQEQFAQGVYRFPPGFTELESMLNTPQVDEEGISIRDDAVGDTVPDDQTRQDIQFHEFWTKDGRLITMLDKRFVVRVQENPFWHGEKPFQRFVDYLQEGEFWGMGEAEAIEALQDLASAMINQRIDNVRLTMDAMFAVNTKAIEDERDLVIRPGGTIRVAGDFMPTEAIQRIDLGDVTQNAYTEAAEIERLIERVSGISAYQLGTGDENVNRTATGVSLITEAGNSKFALKVKLMELMALKPLARQWGAIIQQFADEQEFVRYLGPNGEWLFSTLSPDALQGALDYTIETMSSTQNETVAKEQAITMLQSVSGVWPQAIPQLVKDLLEAFGIRNLTPYFTGMPDLELAQQMMLAQQTGGIVVPFPPAQQQGAMQQQGPPGQEQAPPSEGQQQ